MEYKWFVITNRNKTSKGFGRKIAEHDEVLHFLSGTTNGIPANAKHLPISYLGTVDNDRARDQFMSEVQHELRRRAQIISQSGSNRKPVLTVYIHGFNNSYPAAQNEYIQLRKSFINKTSDNFEDNCLLILFTWPSQGGIMFPKYPKDIKLARKSAAAVARFARLMNQVVQGGLANIAYIVHSLGNFVMLRGMNEIAHHTDTASVLMDNYISIAGDINYKAFEPDNDGIALARRAKRVSVYYSKKDPILDMADDIHEDGFVKTATAALPGAQNWEYEPFLHDAERLGRSLSRGWESTLTNVMFLDCEAWANVQKLKELRLKKSVHSSYKRVPAILSDIYQTIIGSDPEAIGGRQTIVSNKRYKLET